MAEGLWRAIGLARDLEPGAVAGAIVEGREWAAWRAGSGAAHLWEDRCPHRGMRLSFGFVRGDRLACLYHGWQYDGGGQCRYIPAHPELEVPATIRVPDVQIAESAGILWANFGPSTLEAPRLDTALPVRSLYVDAPLAEALRAVAALASKVSDAPGLEDAKIVELDGETLLVAGQIVDQNASALHIALFEPADHARARQKHYAKWAEQVRRAAEAAP